MRLLRNGVPSKIIAESLGLTSVEISNIEKMISIQSGKSNNR